MRLPREPSDDAGILKPHEALFAGHGESRRHGEQRGVTMNTCRSSTACDVRFSGDRYSSLVATLCFLLVAVASGCASRVVIPIRYSGVDDVPSLDPPLRHLKVLVVGFSDVRKNPEVIGRAGSRRVHTTGNVPQLVTEAVVDALCKAGLTVARQPVYDPASSRDYDVVILGRVVEFLATIKSGWSRLPCSTIVSVQCKVICKGGRESEWTETVSGMDERKVESQVYFTEVRDFTDSALQACMRNLVAHLIENRLLECNF